ncbi:MAG: cupin domain-containing protein [Armatimonadetes bacterium]|nr:cupin domain-containing protein [Armatimonadota bacterium]
MKINPNELKAQLPLPATEKWVEGIWDIEALAHGTMSVLYFAPRGKDYQTAHEQDEIYVIIAGSANFNLNGERMECATGDVLFVPAGVEHRFETLTDDFATWAIFYGRKGGEQKERELE